MQNMDLIHSQNQRVLMDECEKIKTMKSTATILRSFALFVRNGYGHFFRLLIRVVGRSVLIIWAS